MSYLIINESCVPVYGENAVTVMNFETNKEVTISGEKFKLFEKWHRGGNVEENDALETLIELKKIILDNKIGFFQNVSILILLIEKGKNVICIKNLIIV